MTKTAMHTVNCIDTECGWSIVSQRNNDGMKCPKCNMPTFLDFDKVDKETEQWFTGLDRWR